jgi:hypothetical protein
MYLSFTSPNTNDRIDIEHGYSPDRCRMKIIQVDDIDGQLLLVKKILLEINKLSYKLIGLSSKSKFYLPDDSLCYRDMTLYNNNLIYCDLDHFEEFFKKNLNHLINMDNVCINDAIKKDNDDGWTTISNVKKDKRNKLNKLLEYVNVVSSNWA